MKKNVLMKSALAVAITATTATAIADVTLYGRYRGGLVFTDDGTNDQISLENRSSRFGIKANHKISDGLTAFGRYEFQVELDEGNLRGGPGRADQQARRLSYVGIKGGFGALVIGSQWTPFYNHVTSPVDPFQLLGGTWQPVGYISTFRAPDAVAYAKDFGIGNVSAAIVMDESAPANDIDRAQIGATFGFGPVSLGLAYDAITDGDEVLGVNLGGKFGPANLSVSYYTQDVEIGGATNDAVMGLIGFGFGDGMNINISLGQDMPDAGPEPTMAAVEFSHKLSKSFRWFAAAQSIDFDSAADDETKVGAGVRLEF